MLLAARKPMDASGATGPAGARRSRLLRIVARILPIVLAALVVLLLARQLPAATRALAGARPIAFLSIVFFFAWNHVATLGWRVLLRATGVSPASFSELVRLRIEAQAVNQVVPAAGVAGEALRTVRAGRRSDLGASSLATILDNACGTVSGLAFATGALAYHLASRGGEDRLRALMATVLAALALIVVAVFLPFHVAPRVLPHLSPASSVRWLVEPLAKSGAEIRRALCAAIALRFGERVLAVGEVYVLFHAVGAPLSVPAAALVSAVLVAVSFAAFFSPGQIGVAEAATAAMGVILGFSVAQGLAAGLLRRARQLAVCALGAVSLLVRRREKKPEAGCSPAEEPS